MAENDCRALVAEGYVAEITSDKNGDTYTHDILIATGEGADWFRVEETESYEIDAINGILRKGCTVTLIYKLHGLMKKTRRQVILIKSYSNAEVASTSSTELYDDNK